MTAITVLVLLLGFLFGGMMLALVMGYVSTEKERAQERARADAAVAAQVAELPPFFLGPEAGRPLAKDDQLDELFVGHFEDYLRQERAVVARFVNEPSIDNLYRQTLRLPVVH